MDVRAPAAGLVLARSVETGQVVSPGSGALFRIAEGGVLEMRALVAEQDMAPAGTQPGAAPAGAASSSSADNPRPREGRFFSVIWLP